jgi:dihydrofolate reductase
MEIKTRFSVSADGYVTTPDGWPALVADPSFVSGKSHGFPRFQAGCEAVLMGSTTFGPALTNDRWPWPDLQVFVLGRDVPTDGAPVPIVTDCDPERLLQKVRSANTGRDVHLVGGLQTIETFLEIGALDKLGLLVLPIFLGAGRRLTERISTSTRLTLEDTRPVAEGSVDIIYRVAR